MSWSSPPSSLLSHSSFIMSLVNDCPGHNKTPHATHSHQQSNIPSRAPHNFIGHNKHKWCDAFAQTFAASGGLNTGLLPPLPPHLFPLTTLQKTQAEHQRSEEISPLSADAEGSCASDEHTGLDRGVKEGEGSSSAQCGNTLPDWNQAKVRRPFTLFVRSSRGQNVTVRPALAIHHPQCCPSDDTGHPSPLATAFYLFFLFLYFCHRQHEGPIRDLRLGALWNGWGFLFIHALSSSSGRLWLSFPTTWN